MGWAFHANGCRSKSSSLESCFLGFRGVETWHVPGLLLGLSVRVLKKFVHKSLCSFLGP